MKLSSREQIVYLCAAASIVGGLVFLSLFPTKLQREELDMHRIVESQALENALEQFLLHKFHRATMNIGKASAAENNDL